MAKRFLCLWCNGNFDSEEQMIKHTHPCPPEFRMINGTITVELSEAIKMKRTRWGRFKDRFWELDWTWCLAFTGLVVMNAILVPHVGLTFKELIGESLALGFAIPRLLK